MSPDPTCTALRQHPPVAVESYTDPVSWHSGSGADAEAAALRDVVLLYASGIPAQAQELEGAWWSVCVHAGAYTAAYNVLLQRQPASPKPAFGTLFTSTQAGASAESRAAYSAQVLRVLRTAFNIDVIGSSHGGPLVWMNRFPHYHTTWYLCDNGGELNVGPVNLHERMRSVAYTGRGGLVDAGTVAYRIAAVLRGEEINYDTRHPELVSEPPASA
jgi:hypothetical protein